MGSIVLVNFFGRFWRIGGDVVNAQIGHLYHFTSVIDSPDIGRHSQPLSLWNPCGVIAVVLGCVVKSHDAIVIEGLGVLITIQVSYVSIGVQSDNLAA